MRKILNTAAAWCAVLCLAVTFVAAGFVVCSATSLPTRALAQRCVTSNISPYTHDELVECAVAIYDYAFAHHDKSALDAVINTQLEAAQAQGRAPEQTNTEEYVLTNDAVSHLDDCYRLSCAVKLPLCVIALLGIAAAAHVYVRTGKKNFGQVLAGAGLLTIAAFSLAGIAALVNFDAFFSVFHGIFFTQGTWTFWYKSLLICSLPESFWVGMGILWFATSVLISILSCCVGFHDIKRARVEETLQEDSL